MRIKNIRRSFDIIEAFRERINIYLKDGYTDQAYKVFIYSLEYLYESKKLIASSKDKEDFIQAKKQTRDIINILKKRKLTKAQKASLVIIAINPCLAFSVGIKLRGLLENIV